MAYRASVPQITATVGLPASETACATPAASTVPGFTASMPPEANRFDRERRTDVVLGERSQWQQQHLRSRPGSFEIAVGAVAQCLETGRVALHRRRRTTPRQRGFREIGVLVDTGERGAPVRDVVGAALGHLGDRRGDKIDFERLDEPAAGFDVPEVLPRLFGQLPGEVFDEPRSAGRVEHPADMGFLQQQQLGVAGHAPRETRLGCRGSRRGWPRRTDAPAPNRHHRRRRRTRPAWCAACSPTDRAAPSSAAT